MEYKNDYNNYLVTSAFKEDNKLSSRVSWQRKLSSLLQKLNINSLTICHKILKNKLKEQYKKKIHEQLNNICKADSGKLSFYNKIVNQNEYELQQQFVLCVQVGAPPQPTNKSHG